MDRRELYQEEFELWEAMDRQVAAGDTASALEALKVLNAAYGKLLNDTVKLNAVADRQYAWLIDSQDRLKTSNEDLQKVSAADMLTGLLNRHKMDRILRDEITFRARGGHPTSMILIDIDHFKMINDTWGHGTGDEVLGYFSQILKNRVRSTDSCARWGGDEFLVLLPHTSAKDAIRITEQIRRAVANARFPGKSFTVSLGVSELGPDMTLEQWLAQTDECLYWAKRQGRNRIGHPDLLPHP
jgi:diguanylate cyclase (GGDEF)-like protein